MNSTIIHRFHDHPQPLVPQISHCHQRHLRQFHIPQPPGDHPKKSFSYKHLNFKARFLGERRKEKKRKEKKRKEKKRKEKKRKKKTRQERKEKKRKEKKRKEKKRKEKKRKRKEKKRKEKKRKEKKRKEEKRREEKRREEKRREEKRREEKRKEKKRIERTDRNISTFHNRTHRTFLLIACVETPRSDCLKGTCTRSPCEYWHPPQCRFYKKETGCKARDKCLFPHHKVDEQPNTKPKKGYYHPKKRKRRQKCCSYCENCTTTGLRLARLGCVGFIKWKTVQGKTDAKSLGMNSKSTIHPVYATSSKYPGKERTIAYSNILISEVPTL